MTVTAAIATGAVLPPAQAQSSPAQSPLAPQVSVAVSRAGAAGNYLAARAANLQRDAAAAATYYRASLRLDPRNPDLTELAFYAVMANGEIDEAARLAERLLQFDKQNRNARLVLGVRALKQKQYHAARTQFAQAARGPITDLAATLLSGWSHYGANDFKGAVDAIDKLTGPDWYAIFKELHAGLILDLAGNRKEAGKRLERAYKLDSTALRVVEAYGSWASRQSKSAKDGSKDNSKDEALKVFQAFDAALPRHPLVTTDMKALQKGDKLPPLVKTPQAGAAEVLYGLGAALGRREQELSLANRGLAYLQLALYLEPDHAMALLSLADLYEAMKKQDLAIAVYERVPETSPLRRNAEIQMAIDLDALERTEEAKQHLQKLIEANPGDVEAILALGNLLRERKQYAECADVYGKAIATFAKPEKSNWTTYYFRGICYERAKHWGRAEADLKKALELYPDQPHVLNYLGYSWVDQGINLDEGMRMIRRSVEQRPDDGYIVDSLGWAHYRLGDFDQAVKQLERAVELKPVDPTINDHLGDAYWRVGRVLEARFQWSHARDLKPEPDDLAKIEAKLKNGMVAEETNSAAVDKSKKPGGGG
jgi:tetratricopeptide (TPR) repeat protein